MHYMWSALNGAGTRIGLFICVCIHFLCCYTGHLRGGRKDGLTRIFKIVRISEVVLFSVLDDITSALVVRKTDTTSTS